MLIDVHCHLTGDEYEEKGGVVAVLDRARRAGVGRFICSGYDLDSSLIACKLSETYDDVYFSAGFHPSDIEKCKDGDLKKLKTLLSHEKCVAVGEIGLDYHFEDNPASGGCMRKAGMTCIGREEGKYLKNGTVHNAILYEIRKE